MGAGGVAVVDHRARLVATFSPTHDVGLSCAAMKRLAAAVVAAIVSYVVGAFLGGWLLLQLSSNRHDASVEAAMTGAFVFGPLAAFLAYAGLRHAWLVADLRGSTLLVALAAGAVGAALGNLAVTTVAVLAFDHGRRWLRQRVRPAA